MMMRVIQPRCTTHKGFVSTVWCKLYFCNFHNSWENSRSHLEYLNDLATLECHTDIASYQCSHRYTSTHLQLQQELFFETMVGVKNKSKCFACFYPIAFFFGTAVTCFSPGPPSEPLAWTRQERSQKVNLQFSMWKNSRRASHKQAQHAMNIHGANHGATGVFSQIQPAVHRSIPYITQIRRSIWIFFGNIYGNIIWIIHFGLFSQFDSVFP